MKSIDEVIFIIDISRRFFMQRVFLLACVCVCFKIFSSIKILSIHISDIMVTLLGHAKHCKNYMSGKVQVWLQVEVRCCQALEQPPPRFMRQPRSRIFPSRAPQNPNIVNHKTHISSSHQPLWCREPAVCNSVLSALLQNHHQSFYSYAYLTVSSPIG